MLRAFESWVDAVVDAFPPLAFLVALGYLAVFVFAFWLVVSGILTIAGAVLS